MNKIILTLTLCLCCLASMASLNPGDVVVIGFNTSGAGDQVTIMATRSFTGEVFSITDAGWISGNGFRLGEGYITSGISTMQKGQIIRFKLYAGEIETGDGSYTMTGNMDLAAAGDQLIIYQGSHVNPSLIYALNYNGKIWNNAGDAATSAIPDELVNGKTAISLINKGNYMYGQKIDLSDMGMFFADLGNFNSWKGKDGLPYAISATSFQMGPITRLKPGDIALIGYNDKTDDELVFVALRNIEAGTQFKITDRGWSGSAFFQNEGTWTYTAPLGGIVAGAIIRGPGPDFNAIESFDLNIIGDQILVYQGSESAPIFIYALNTRGVWAGDANYPTNSVAPDVVSQTGVTIVRQTTSSPVEGNAYYIGSHTGTVKQILANVANPSMYIYAGGLNKITIPPLLPFTILVDQDCAVGNFSPSTNQNFVLTRTFKVPGVNSLNVYDNRSACEENIFIQYLDGLGRPSQSVSWQDSPTKKDVVHYMEYDGLGRETRMYRPYADHFGSDGSFKTTARNDQQNFFNSLSSWDANVVKTDYPFAVKVLEPSPLAKIKEVGAEGLAWQPAVTRTSTTGRTNAYDYYINYQGEVKFWALDPLGASVLYAFPTNKLTKKVTRDPNWSSGLAGTVEEFLDQHGKLVMKKIWSTELVSLDTYYVYDTRGNLTYVIPPSVSVSTFNTADAVFDQYIYAYRYDKWNRLVEKKIPGRGWEYFVYNNFDKLVMSQDARQRSDGKWCFTKYDKWDRNIITGMVASTNGRQTWQDDFDAQPITQSWEERDNTNSNNTRTGYTNTALPYLAITVYHTLNYYDDYKFYGNNSSFDFSTTAANFWPSNALKDKLTGTMINVLGTTVMLLTINYYDDKGRMIQIKSANYKDGSDQTDNIYDFSGQLVESRRQHITDSHSSNPKKLTISNAYFFDHTGRSTRIMENINYQGWVTTSGLFYNEIGEIKTKSLHSIDGINFIQSTDYSYNERGWPKNTTSAQFSEQLSYDVAEIGSSPQFNGNISSQKWNRNNGVFQISGYTYDKLNRLTAASSPGLSENIVYDVQGNILSMDREGYGSNAYIGYDGNKLTQISGFTNSTYQYDVNGNMTFDSGKNINIGYNFLNLPELISGSQAIQYIYDANGSLLKKISNTTGTTQYIGGIQYKNDGNIDFVQTDEGISKFNGISYLYHYNLTDHLGNVRYTFDIFNNLLRRLQEDDYYAFGLRKAIGTTTSNANNKLYSGRELHEELGIYNYGARFYDPVLGRWAVADPMAGLFASESPYSFAGSSPVNFVDQGGRFRITAYFAKKYPTLARMLEFYMPMLKDNKAIKNAMMSVTGMSSEEFDKMVSYGSGPWITPTKKYNGERQWNNPVFQSGSGFSPERYTENLFISYAKLEALERSFKKAVKEHSSDELGFQMFVTSMTIMHEAAHYGLFKFKAKGDLDTFRNFEVNNETGAVFEGLSLRRFSYLPGKTDQSQDEGLMRNYYKKNEGSDQLRGLSFVRNPYPNFDFNVMFLKWFSPPKPSKFDGKDPHINPIDPEDHKH